MNNKKALGPVIATALLIVVVVITLVLFNTWFQSYSSNLMADVEIQSSINAIPEIEGVIGDFVYIKTPSNLTIDRLLVDGNECEVNVSMTQRMQGVNISDCLDSLSTSTPKITLITDKSIVTESIYLKDVVLGSGSGLNIVGSECRFQDNKSSCESYYETTIIDGIDVVHDRVHGLYWQQNASSYLNYSGLKLNWTDAVDYCSNLGDGNWRLPTLVEIDVSLTDASRGLTAPHIVGGEDNGLFYDTRTDDNYWTYTRYSGTEAYHFIFNGTWSWHENIGTGTNHVLCVREDTDTYNDVFSSSQKHSFNSGLGQIRNESDFELNSPNCGGDYTIYDSLTNLCWTMNSTSSEINWTTAVNHCETDLTTFAGGNWQLPQRSELMTLLYHNGLDATQTRLTNIGFNNIHWGYWSNTKYSWDNRAYKVIFLRGLSTSNVIIDINSVLCVKTP